MNRIIKFRGKRLCNGEPTDEWVYGSLRMDYGGIDSNSLFKRDPDPDLYTVGLRACEIYDPKTHSTYAVNTDTVGQCTGIKDINGVEIYENDKVRFYDEIEDKRIVGRVIWDTPTCSFCVKAPKREVLGLCSHWQFEVVGNIHDKK